MQIEDLVDELDLPFEGEMKGDQYVIDVETSDDFSTLFNLIDVNRDFKIIDDQVATNDRTHFRFTDGNFEINLDADYNKDKYRLTISER